MSKRVQGFDVNEEVAIGLPHLYQCKNCYRIIHCMRQPEDEICGECYGDPRPYEKAASVALLRTVTGRTSSKEPNTQNIPLRTELGGAVRKAFISGTHSGDVDFSAIERRIEEEHKKP